MATQTVPKCLEMPRFQPQRAPAHRWRQDLDAGGPMPTETVPKCLEMPRSHSQKAPAHRLRQRIWTQESLWPLASSCLKKAASRVNCQKRSQNSILAIILPICGKRYTL